MPSNATPPPTTSDRPIPLIARHDIEAESVHYQGSTYWVVKDLLSLEYFRLQPEQYAVLKLLDGERGLEEIQAELTRQFPTCRATSERVYKLILDLGQKGLAWSARPGQGESLARRRRERVRKKWLGAARSLFFFRLPGWDPQRLLVRGDAISRWLFHPLVLITAALLLISAWGLLLVRFDHFQQRLPRFDELLSWQTISIVWLTIGGAKILHEFGHAFACRRFGGECHEIGLAFLVFSPCMYCDVSDSWMLSSKWKRIAIAAAGMYVEMVLSAIALLLWWVTRDGLLSDILLQVFLVTNITTIVFNLNPLLRLDGYYILSDWLEIPNMRRKSDQLFQQTFAQWCLGIRPVHDPFLPQHGRPWFVSFSIASAIYRWFMVFAICTILYQVLKPYHLQHFGLALGSLSAFAAVGGGLKRIGDMIAMNRDDVRKSLRPRVSLAAAAVLVGLALLVPLPLHVDAPLVVEPDGVRHIYSSTPGRLLEVHVQPGDHVQRGQVLAQLANASKQDRYEQLVTAAEIQQVELRVQQSLGDAAQESLASETLRAIQTEVEDYRRQLERLTIVAPCDGKVVASPHISEQAAKRSQDSLSQWHGTPLDQENDGCFLQAGTHVLSIAPNERYQAMLLIDQSDRHDFGTSGEVTMKIDHLPGRTFHGAVSHIATGTVDLSDSRSAAGVSKNLRALVASDFREPSRPVYQAAVSIDAEAGSLLPGMTGQVRVLVMRRTAAQWLWRTVRKTFNFHL